MSEVRGQRTVCSVDSGIPSVAWALKAPARVHTRRQGRLARNVQSGALVDVDPGNVAHIRTVRVDTQRNITLHSCPAPERPQIFVVALVDVGAGSVAQKRSGCVDARCREPSVCGDWFSTETRSKELHAMKKTESMKVRVQTTPASTSFTAQRQTGRKRNAEPPTRAAKCMRTQPCSLIL